MSAEKAAMFVVGLILIFIPEPATTIFGVLLVLATFGLEDEVNV